MLSDDRRSFSTHWKIPRDRCRAIHDVEGGYGELFEHHIVLSQIEKYATRPRRNAGKSVITE